jgi:hypothetical protein
VILDLQNLFLLQFGENLIEDTLLRPTIHAHVDAMPIAKPLRQFRTTYIRAQLHRESHSAELGSHDAHCHAVQVSNFEFARTALD